MDNRTIHVFDLSYDCHIQDFLTLLDRHELKMESWITEGPGGGNPEITVSGTPENISNLEKEMESW
jgi:hypothetical protein